MSITEVEGIERILDKEGLNKNGETENTKRKEEKESRWVDHRIENTEW